MSGKIALFPGTFDPPTLGHLDIIQRASALFDTLYVGVSPGGGKRAPVLPLGDRIHLLETLVASLRNVEVIEMRGLAVDCAAEWKAKYLVRGVRGVSDFDYEWQMGATNRQVAGVETVVLLASPKYSHIASTLVRELGAGGRSLKGLVPDAIEEAVVNRLRTH